MRVANNCMLADNKLAVPEKLRKLVTTSVCHICTKTSLYNNAGVVLDLGRTNNIYFQKKLVKTAVAVNTARSVYVGLIKTTRD